MLKNIFIIINPISGPLYPILPVIARAMKRYGLKWEVRVTRTKEESYSYTKEAIDLKVDAVVVYGGDGTIMDVARALCQTKIPLAIIPGGTANVLSKELGIPQDPAKAVRILGRQKPKFRYLDMGVCNDREFILRISCGIFADMVKSTTRQRKRMLGPVGYIVSAFQHIVDHKPSTYYLELDGRKVEIEGVSLMIANSVNVGLPGVSLVPNVAVDDGKLDVVVFQQANTTSILSILKGTVLQTHVEPLSQWKVSSVRLRIKPVQTIIIDDEILETDELRVSILPKAVKVLV